LWADLEAKRAGLHLMDNVELDDEPEKALLEVITKRELWRVAQGQYDPLGLLCGFTIHFKVLMRTMVDEVLGKVVVRKTLAPPTLEECTRCAQHGRYCEDGAQPVVPPLGQH
jgi:hypothetical protein